MLFFLLAFLVGPFTRVTVLWGKGNNHIFQELLGSDSELMLILENLNHHCGLPVRVESYGGQEINAFLAYLYFTVGPVSPYTHSVVIS